MEFGYAWFFGEKQLYGVFAGAGFGMAEHDTNKEKLQQVLANDPLALIEYWSIDPDYDGVTFRSQWQDYRENTGNDNDPLHCVYRTSLIVPRKASRTVCVKAVDVFGYEAMVTEQLVVRN